MVFSQIEIFLSCKNGQDFPDLAFLLGDKAESFQSLPLKLKAGKQVTVSQQPGGWEVRAGGGGSRSESWLCHYLGFHMLLPVPGWIRLSSLSCSAFSGRWETCFKRVNA